MADNIIRFPGFIVLGRNEVAKDCQVYPNFKAMVLALPPRDRERAHKWHIKKCGRSNYRAFVFHSLAEPSDERAKAKLAEGAA